MENTEILNSREEIAKLDTENVLGSVEALPEQCVDAWSKASEVTVPDYYKDVNKTIFSGMGGSGLGARFIESVFFKELKYPLIRVNDYNLPGYVDEHSLVVCSSYSGTTEETVENAKQAIEKRAKWMAIGTGNTIIEMAEEKKVPYYKIEPLYNPSNQPRMAIGYSIIGQLVLAGKCGVIDITQGDVSVAVRYMKEVQDKCRQEISTESNPAKQLAMKLKGKIIMYVAAEHLTGAIHTVNNQLNENAKNISFDVQIPELNHHLMEGLKHPEVNSNNLFVFFANSALYGERIKKRFEVTSDIVSKNNIEFYEYKSNSDDAMSQAFQLIQFGAYVNFYLSMLYGQNPAPIPWVDYFKKQMGQSLGK